MTRLFKVERHEFDFVLADNEKQADTFNLDNSHPVKTVTEITDLAPGEPGLTGTLIVLKTILGLAKPAASG